MQFILIGSGLFISMLIVRLLNYYKPNIDVVLNNDRKAIIIWYNIYEDNVEIRKYKTLITF